VVNVGSVDINVGSSGVGVGTFNVGAGSSGVDICPLDVDVGVLDDEFAVEQLLSTTQAANSMSLSCRVVTGSRSSSIGSLSLSSLTVEVVKCRPMLKLTCRPQEQHYLRSQDQREKTVTFDAAARSQVKRLVRPPHGWIIRTRY
jgi:hypothetical protein